MHTLTIYLTTEAQIAEAAAGRDSAQQRDLEIPTELVPRVIALGGVISKEGRVTLDAGSIPYHETQEPENLRVSRYGGVSLYGPAHADAAAAVAWLEAQLAEARAQQATRLVELTARREIRTRAEAAERERSIAAQRQRLAELSDEQLAEQIAHGRRALDPDLHVTTGSIYECLTRVGGNAPDELRAEIDARIPGVQAACRALLAARAAAAEAAAQRVRAILREHAPQMLARHEADVLPTSELETVLRGVLLAPFADFPGYEKLTKDDVRAAEAAEHADDEDDFEPAAPVVFDVDDVDDGEYVCSAAQWELITRLRKLAAEHGCTANVRLHTGTTKRMSDYVRRLGMRVCCEYAPDKRVCRELAITD